jgi:hypothetical protein
VELGDAPRDRDEVGVEVPLLVGVCVDELVPVRLAVSVVVLVINIGDVEADAVMDAEAPGESGGVGDALVVDDALTVVDPLSLPEGVPLHVAVAVAESLPVGVTVGVCDVLAVEVVLADPLSLPVLLGPAPFVTLDVGVREIERERDCVELGVSEDVGLDVPVGDPVGVPLSD